jgi:hypothetical protein
MNAYRNTKTGAIVYLHGHACGDWEPVDGVKAEPVSEPATSEEPATEEKPKRKKTTKK